MLPYNRTPIKKIFKITGVAAATANLLCEFNIAEKKDDRLIKSKKGKVILVRLIAKFILSSLPWNPGAIRNTKAGINISIIRTKKNKPIINKLNIFVAKLWDWSLPFVSSAA